MASRKHVLALSVVLLSLTGSAEQKRHSHPGTIVDAVTGNGIEANASAYGSQKQVGDGGCPKYEDWLDSQRSESGTGSFAFYIDSNRSSYLAAYCQGGYIARVVTSNDNKRDGTRVQPDPVSLYPSQVKIAKMKMERVDAAYIALTRQLSLFQANLDYFSRADEEAFYKALGRFSAEEKNAIQLLRAKKRETQQF